MITPPSHDYNCDREQLVTSLCDPVMWSLDEAKRVAREMTEHEANLDLRLLQHAVGRYAEQGGKSTVLNRALEILTEISDCRRVLPQLVQILRTADWRVRSKVVLLIGRIKRDPEWLQPFLRDPDFRMRANAVASLWEEKSQEVLREFRLASRDKHHRVAANAIVGLYLAGEASAPDLLREMAKSDVPLRQAAAAWAMGFCGDLSFEPDLKVLAASPDSTVKRGAHRSLVALRKRLLSPEAVPPIVEAAG